MSYLAAGDTPGAIMAGLVLVTCLIVFVTFVRRTIVFLDRATGRVVVRVATVFGQRESGVALAEVARAEVDTKVATQSDDVDTHRPVLRLNGGGVLVLREVFASGRATELAVERINLWLARG